MNTFPDAARKKEVVNNTEDSGMLHDCLWRDDVRKHRMENVAGCSKLMDTHVEQLLHQIVETMGTVRRFIFIF